VQATQLAIKHALARQSGRVAVLFSHDALAGSVGPDSQPALYPTRFYPRRRPIRRWSPRPPNASSKRSGRC
jgi:hypothetical protein